MTTVQIESIGKGTVTISIDDQGRLLADVHENTDQGGIDYNTCYVSNGYTTGVNLSRFVAKGFAIVDTQRLVTCPGCGAYVGHQVNECDACAADEDNRRDDRQMYTELRGGM